MLHTITRTESLARLPLLPLLSAISIAGFSWLLISDSIQPIAIYLLQLYLTF